MGDYKAREGEDAKTRGWKGLATGLAGGAAFVWSGVDHLRSPYECREGRRIVGEITAWLCHSIGGTGTGVLYVLLGVLFLFGALMWERHDT